MVEKSAVKVDGKMVEVRRILKDGTNYIAARDIAEALGYNISNEENMAVMRKK